MIRSPLTNFTATLCAGFLINIHFMTTIVILYEKVMNILIIINIIVRK
jgi:hypothetical protein